MSRQVSSGLAQGGRDTLLGFTHIINLESFLYAGVNYLYDFLHSLTNKMTDEGDLLGFQGEGHDACCQRGGGRRPGEVNCTRVVEVCGGLWTDEEMDMNLNFFY